MRATWGIVALALTGCVHTEWHPESARELGQLVPHAGRVYAGDLQALRDAGAHKVGSIEATGTGTIVDYDQIADKAGDEGAERGGTHVYLATTDVRWNTVVNAGHANTTCERDGQQVNCATSYTPPTESHYAKPHAWIIVIRVEREHWDELPRHLQPRPAAK